MPNRENDRMTRTLRFLPVGVLGSLVAYLLVCSATGAGVLQRPPIKEEEDTPPGRKIKPPPIIEEYDEPPIKKPKPAPPSEGPFDLAEQARKAGHPALEKLLRDLAKPQDVVVTKSEKRWITEPMPRRFDPNGAADLRNFQGVDAAGNKLGPIDLPRAQIKEVIAHEDRVLAEVRKLLASDLDQRPEAGKPAVSRYQMLRAAEMVLSETLRFHKEPKRREGDGWKEVSSALERDLLQAKINQVPALATEKQWELAEVIAARLFKQNPGNREVIEAIEKLYLAQAELALAQKQFVRVREHMETLKKEYFRDESEGIKKVQLRLQEHSASLFDQGRKLVDEAQNEPDAGQARRKRSQALRQLAEAEKAWPDLRGLSEFRRQVERQHPVLRVGVRTLPSQMSPTTAETDADRLAVRLLFDQLLKLRNGPSARDGYVCKLGAEPRVTSRGWEFVLPGELRWSDGKPVIAADVDRSVQLLKHPRAPFYDPFAAELLKVQTDDAQRTTLSLDRPCLDPLALLTFDLLPAHRLNPNDPRDPAFSKHPVGTGPYVFDRMEGNEVVLAVNPLYRRPHAPHGPIIQEICFTKYTDPEAAQQAILSGDLHLLLDMTDAERDELERAGARVALLTPTISRESKPPYLSNPRIHFLAPNYRRPALQNEDLRRAIALGIDREAILRQVFRGRDKQKYHQVLNGPFPVGSWAYHPDFAPDKTKSYNPEQARKHLEKAKTALGSLPRLSLRHAADDREGARACARMRDMLRALGLTITVEATPRARLVAKLGKDQPDFDLLYWHHDFDSETLSLWPLFDPNGVGERGRNYLGYTGDAELESVFRDLHGRRDFRLVQTRMHDLHELIQRKMILIPLWQLDRHVAIHPSLKLPLSMRLHPLWIFDDVELWKVEPRD